MTAFDASISAFEAHEKAAGINLGSVEQLRASLETGELADFPDIIDALDRLEESVQAIGRESAAAKQTMTTNHGKGKEYHQTGTDAHETAFR
jgi:hypothetical protein